MSLVAASANDFAQYPKALRVFVPASGAVAPHITIRPAGNDDDAGGLQALTLPEGMTTIIDEVAVRAVTAIGAGVTVRRIDD